MNTILKELKVIKVEDTFISMNFDSQIAYRYLFQLNCKNTIETTAYLHFKNKIPSNLAIDISTMVGCPMDCQFCATSSQKYERQLTSEEIIEQVKLLIRNHDNKNIPEITCSFQGIGEPSLMAKEIIHVSKQLLKLDKRIILSIATMGNNLKAFDIWRNSNLPIFSLQLSCSGATNNKLKDIMPNSPKIELLVEELTKCTNTKNISKVKLNYILIKGYNDTIEDINNLIDIMKNKNIIVKISSLNNTTNTQGNNLNQSSKNEAIAIVEKLRENNILSYVYGTFNDTTISCGQLLFNTQGGNL
jgi:23S rRNA (adenine2503-C2)-methyltransferase